MRVEMDNIKCIRRKIIREGDKKLLDIEEQRQRLDEKRARLNAEMDKEAADILGQGDAIKTTMNSGDDFYSNCKNFMTKIHSSDDDRSTTS